MTKDEAARLGAASRQRAALCIIAYRACLRLGFRPSKRMTASALWGHERGVTADDFKPKGLKR